MNRLVEATTKFRRLDRFGLKNRYQASVRGNPEELEVIRMFSGKYEPKLYAYYSSYASASVRETARGGSMLKSPTLIIGVLGLLVAVAWFAFGGWLSGAKPVPPAAAVSTLPPPPPLPAAPVSQPVAEHARVGAVDRTADPHSRWHDARDVVVQTSGSGCRTRGV